MVYVRRGKEITWKLSDFRRFNGPRAGSLLPGAPHPLMPGIVLHCFTFRKNVATRGGCGVCLIRNAKSAVQKSPSQISVFQGTCLSVPDPHLKKKKFPGLWVVVFKYLLSPDPWEDNPI